MSRRRLPTHLLAAAIGLLLAVFIACPIGLILLESVKISSPVPLGELAALTRGALDKLEPADRERQVARWRASLKPDERVAAAAATFTLIGRPVPWRTDAPFDEQSAAVTTAVAALPPAERARYDATFDLAAVTLSKRVPLAFRVRDKLMPAEFDALREGTRDRMGLDNYAEVVHSPRLQRALRNSLGLSALVAVLTTALGFAVAFGINRRAIPSPGLVRYLTLIPLVAPPVVISTSLVLLFGRNGVVTKGLLADTLGWIDADRTNLYGWTGVILAEVLGHVPAAFIVLDNVLSKQDGRLEEAAASQGAGGWDIFRRVTLPMAQPGLVRSLVLVFMVTMTDFGNPLVIGRDIPVLAGVLYDEMTGFQNTRLAGALAVWMVVPALMVYWGIERIGRRKRYATVVSGPPELPVPRRLRVALTTVAWTTISFTALLYGTIVLASFVTTWRVDNSFTLAWYVSGSVKGFGSEQLGVASVLDSLKVAALAAPAGGVLAIVLAYIVERARPPGAGLLGFVAILPAVLPGIVIGLGYVVSFNLPLGRPALSLTGTVWILVLNVLFTNLYIGYLAGRTVLQRYDAALDEAAESLGASLWQRFAWVTLPLMRHALMLGTLYVFIHGLTTLSAVIFLVSPAYNLASVGIFVASETGYYGSAAALSVTILVVVFAAMGLMQITERFGPAWARVGAAAAGRAGR